MTRALALAAAPVLLAQARRTRRRIPRLPEAAGPRSGQALPGNSDAAAPLSGHALPETVGAATPLSALVVGESTAVGVGAATQETALAGHFARTLAGGTDRPVAWTALGRSGATARDVLRDIVPEADGIHDVVILVLGVNDTLALTSLQAWRTVIEQVLSALEPRLTANGRMVLAGLPAVGRFAALPQPMRAILGRHAVALDDALADLARERTPRALHVRTPVLGSGPMQAVDRFHPSALGYGLWGGHLARELREWGPDKTS